MSASASWSCFLAFTNVYQTHLPPALVCHSYVRALRVFPGRFMSELLASRVFAWRYVPAVKCGRVLQQQLPPTAMYTVTHTHIRTHSLIMPSTPPRQMLLFTLQRTLYEHPLGDIRRLEAKVVDNIVHYVTAGRAPSVAGLQRQYAARGGSPPLRLVMGQRARTMGFDLSDSIHSIKRFSDFEV